jgi:2-polyprenyl-3-methyl-5-hydroxy-6-metoxy-1,4-benzoquinol methylase
LSGDRSNGWEAVALRLIADRSRIGESVVRDWCRTLPPAAEVLDLGCGAGVPVTEALLAQGCRVHGIDAAPTLVAAYAQRFPGVPVRCEAAEDSDLFGRQFDGIVSVGLLFLLSPAAQMQVIPRMGQALRTGGRLLFSSPQQVCSWNDLLPRGRTREGTSTTRPYAATDQLPVFSSGTRCSM